MQMATVPERMSARRCDLGRESTEGLRGHCTDEPAPSLHLDHAGGNWNMGEKPVDLKITYRAGNERGVGARAATRVPLRPIRPGWTRSSEAREGESASARRGPMALVPMAVYSLWPTCPGRVGFLSHAVLAPTPVLPPP